MHPEVTSNGSDPLGLRIDLREALILSERDRFDDEEGHSAAYQLAVALGRCRLFGVDAGEDDETLSVPLALAAVEQWKSHAARWRQQADELPTRWDKANSEIEADSLCLDLLEARMESWAIFIAIDEAFEDCLQTGTQGYADFVKQLDLMMDEIDRLDAVLEKQKAFLCVAAGTCLLENWRRLLAPMYRQVLPWWLDGTLEDAWRALRWEPAPNLGDLLRPNRRAVSALSHRPAVAAQAVGELSLSPEAVHLNSTVFCAEGDDSLRLGFDLAVGPSGEELRVYLSPPEAACCYSQVRVVLGEGEPQIGELLADFASLPFEPAALDLLTEAARGTFRVELLTTGGQVRAVLIQDTAA